MSPLFPESTMGHGVKSSTGTSWTLLLVLVVDRGKPLQTVSLYVHAENLQHCSLDFSWIPRLNFLPFLTWHSLVFCLR